RSREAMRCGFVAPCRLAGGRETASRARGPFRQQRIPTSARPREGIGARLRADYLRNGMSASASKCALSVLVSLGCVSCNSEDAVLALNFSDGAGGTNEVGATSTTGTAAAGGNTNQDSTVSGGSGGSGTTGG